MTSVKVRIENQKDYKSDLKWGYQMIGLIDHNVYDLTKCLKDGCINEQLILQLNNLSYEIDKFEFSFVMITLQPIILLFMNHTFILE